MRAGPGHQGHDAEGRVHSALVCPGRSALRVGREPPGGAGRRGPGSLKCWLRRGLGPQREGGTLPTAGPCLHHLQPGELQVRKPLGGSSSSFLEEPVSVPGRQLRCRRAGPHPSQPPASPGAARDDLQCRGNRIKCKDQES